MCGIGECKSFMYHTPHTCGQTARMRTARLSRSIRTLPLAVRCSLLVLLYEILKLSSVDEYIDQRVGAVEAYGAHVHNNIYTFMCRLAAVATAAMVCLSVHTRTHARVRVALFASRIIEHTRSRVHEWRAERAERPRLYLDY